MPRLADLRDCLEDAIDMARRTEATEYRLGHWGEAYAAKMATSALRIAANTTNKELEAARVARAAESPPSFGRRIWVALTALIGGRQT